MRDNRAAPLRRRLLAAMAALPALPHVVSARTDEILFAGTSFTGNAAEIEQRFPLLSAVMRNGADAGTNGPGPFEKRLRRAVLDASPRHFTVGSREPLMHQNAQRGNALSMAFSHESVKFQQLNGVVVGVYEIAAQVLFFEYGAAAPKVIASYPVRLRYTDTTSIIPGQEHQLGVMRYLLRSELRTGLAARWLRKMVSAMPSAGARLVGIELPEFDDKARRQLPVSGSDAVPHELAQFLAEVISEEWRVPIVPGMTSGTIGGKMVQVFANGDAIEYSLPEPTFTVKVTVRDLRKSGVQVECGTHVAYGAFITLGVNGQAGPVAELRYIDVLSVTLNELGRNSLDDWTHFDQALRSVLTQSVRQVTAIDRSWTTAKSATPQATAQLDAIRSELLLP